MKMRGSRDGYLPSIDGAANNEEAIEMVGLSCSYWIVFPIFIYLILLI